MALTARIPLQLEPEEKRAVAQRAKAVHMTVNEYVRSALRAFDPEALREEHLDWLLRELDASADRVEKRLDATLAACAASRKRMARNESAHARRLRR